VWPNLLEYRVKHDRGHTDGQMKRHQGHGQGRLGMQKEIKTNTETFHRVLISKIACNTRGLLRTPEQRYQPRTLVTNLRVSSASDEALMECECGGPTTPATRSASPSDEPQYVLVTESHHLNWLESRIAMENGAGEGFQGVRYDVYLRLGSY
jgi:hypothetical protein